MRDIIDPADAATYGRRPRKGVKIGAVLIGVSLILSGVLLWDKKVDARWPFGGPKKL